MKAPVFLATGTALLLTGGTAASAATVPGEGGSDTEDMTVSMTVQDSCDFSITSNVDFGIEGPVTTGNAAETSGEISVACTSGTEFSLSLEEPETGTRAMSSGIDDASCGFSAS